jgi:phosphoglycerate dehydrogenase-like enzyme
LSKSTKILVYSPDIAEAKLFGDMARGNGYTAVWTASTPEEAEKKLSDTEVILAWQFPIHLISSPEASSVKWIQSMGAGVDHLLNSLPILDQISITRILDQFSEPIAEYVFAYLLYLNQDISRTQTAQKEIRWEPFQPGLLSGKTIGIAGLGSIGKEIVKKARSFNMTVFGLSYSGKQAHLVDRHYDPSEWNAFVRELDYLVITLPLTDKTRHVVNREILLAMKPNAYLVNVGRGNLIVEEDLIDILNSGHLQGVILDVFENEPLPKENPLWKIPNVYVTAHMSGLNSEGVGRFFIENLNRYHNGEPLLGSVDRSSGY